MAEPMTTAEKLVEAEQIYHEWMTGQTVRSWRDQNGESVEYSQSGLQRLGLYIIALRSEIANAGQPVRRGPLRFTFSG